LCSLRNGEQSGRFAFNLHDLPELVEVSTQSLGDLASRVVLKDEAALGLSSYSAAIAVGLIRVRTVRSFGGVTIRPWPGQGPQRGATNREGDAGARPALPGNRLLLAPGYSCVEVDTLGGWRTEARPNQTPGYGSTSQYRWAKSL